MTFNLDLIETVAVVIMENRSFDHVLGYRSLPAYGKLVDGQSTDPNWLAHYGNSFNGNSTQPFYRTDLELSGDPPHEHDDVRIQIGADFPWPNGSAPMNGFASNYATGPGVPAAAYAEVMGYYTPAEVPTAHFLAENFAICDRWFSSLPASTQPNRLMAMAGYSEIDNTFSDTVPDQELVYDWCDRQVPPVPWRVYHEGWPFFMVMPRWRLKILEDAVVQDKFRTLDKLEADLNSNEPFPKLVFLEPKYTDDHFSSPTPSDDHPPSSISGGQLFLQRVYNAFRSSRYWDHVLIIIFYDENGGLFDHASPLAIPGMVADTAEFATTGIRVPAYLVSPLIRAGQVFHGVLDHTSVLRFIGQKFATNGSYSAAVTTRATSGTPLMSIGDALNAVGTNPVIRTDCPVITRAFPNINLPPADRPQTPQSQAFAHALLQIRREQAQYGAIKFPELAGFFRSPSPAWQLVQAEMKAHGVSLHPDCQHLVRELAERADVQALKEGGRRRPTDLNLIDLTRAMVSQARLAGQTRVIREADYRRARALYPGLLKVD
jgi:phospholipase C